MRKFQAPARGGWLDLVIGFNGARAIGRNYLSLAQLVRRRRPVDSRRGVSRARSLGATGGRQEAARGDQSAGCQAANLAQLQALAATCCLTGEASSPEPPVVAAVVVVVATAAGAPIGGRRPRGEFGENGKILGATCWQLARRTAAGNRCRSRSNWLWTSHLLGPVVVGTGAGQTAAGRGHNSLAGHLLDWLECRPTATVQRAAGS